MYEIEKVKELEGKSNSALADMQKLVDSLTAKIDAFKVDGSRSESFNAERIQKTRGEALPAISAQNEIITATEKELYAQKPFYESKPLILSLETFNNDPAKDATIRANLGRELATMPIALLRLSIESAKADKNLPFFYQGYLAATARNNEFRQAGGFDVGIESVDIPNQLEGLAAISQAKANVKMAEFLLIDAIAARVSPYSRLNSINARDAAAQNAAANRTAAATATASRLGIS
jgi:hypothetical protein